MTSGRCLSMGLSSWDPRPKYTMLGAAFWMHKIAPGFAVSTALGVFDARKVTHPSPIRRNFVPCAVSYAVEDARASHPCERGAGLLSATTGDRRRITTPTARGEILWRCVVNREPQHVPATSRDFLNSCLVEGDPEFEQRARKGKRRAIVFSIFLQTIIVSGLLLYPLLGKSEHIVYERTPLPPYPHLGNHNADNHRTNATPRQPQTIHTIHFNTSTPTIRPATNEPNQSSNAQSDGPARPTEGVPWGIPEGIANTTSDKGPVKPFDDGKT